MKTRKKGMRRVTRAMNRMQRQLREQRGTECVLETGISRITFIKFKLLQIMSYNPGIGDYVPLFYLIILEFEMTWYFNFCNYFLPSDPVINNNRMALFIMMGIQVLFYAFVRIIIVYYQGGEAFKQKLKLKNSPQNLEETVDKLSGDVEEKEEKGKSDNLSTDKDKSDESKSSDGNESGVHILKDGKRGYGDEPPRRLGKMGEMFSTVDFLTF